MENIKKLTGLFLLLFSTLSYALDFAAQVSYELSETSPADIVSADFNNDGNTDIAVAMSGEAGGVGNVSILLGDGAGAFPTHNGLAVIVGVDGLGYTPLGLGSGDFNGDGNLELIVTAGDAGAYDAHIYQGDGTGQFSFMTTVQSGGESPGAVITADFNGDANLDFALANSSGSGSGVSVFMGDGAGGFSVAQNISDTDSIAAKDIVASDLDHDGDIDIAIPQMVLLNDGSGVLSRSGNIGITNPRAIVLGDMNQDGWLDVVVLGSAGIAIWTNNQGIFSASHLYSDSNSVTPSLRGLAVIDLDLDSRLDVVFADELNDMVRILTGNGNGTLSATTQSLSVGNEPRNVAAADWNNDGYVDLMAVLRNGGGVPFASVLLQQVPVTQPAAGQLQFSSSAYHLPEDTVDAFIKISRVGGSAGAVSVDYATSDGSATAGSDYTGVSGTLNFSDGEIVKQFNVEILDDNVYEGNENINLTLGNVTGGATLGVPATASLNIMENDPVPPAGSLQFAFLAYGFAEDITTALVKVTRTGGSYGAVDVDYTTSDGSAGAGSDYIATSGTLGFADGETIKTIAVDILDDAIYEGDKTFSITLSNITGGAALGTPATVTIFITENEPVPPAGNLQFSSASYQISENGANASISVTRAGGSFGAVSVDYTGNNGSASAGSDYVTVNGTLNFADGEISKSFNVSIIDDAVYEGDETLSLQLSNASGAVLGTVTTASLTIIENDPVPPAGSLQFSASTYQVAENGVNVNIAVTRTGGSYGAVNIDYAGSNGSADAGSDYVAVNGTLNFADGEISKSFNVSIIDDAVYEGDETISLQLSNAQGEALLGSPAVAVLTIIENELFVDVTPPVITPAADIVVDAEGLLTHVDLLATTANDDQDGPVLVLPDRTGPFVPGRHEIIWSATDSAGNVASEIQRVDVRPLVEFMPDQQAMTGATVKIRVLLNGDAAEYPVHVSYEVFEDSFAAASHTGVLEIASGRKGGFDYMVPTNISGGNITFKLSTVSNAVKGPVATHQVQVISENVVPTAVIKITQNGVAAQTVTADGGPVTVQVFTADANAMDTHSYDWSMTDNVLLANSGLPQTEFIIDPSSLIPGFYRLAVMVTDDGTPALASEIEFWLQILKTTPLLTDADSDGDGIDDISEGLADSDADGIPDYLDAINNPAVIQGKSGVSDKWLLNAQPGLGIRLGSIALFAGRNTAHVTSQEITLHTGTHGGAVPAETVDIKASIGGYFDFEIYGLTQTGSSALLVIPQHAAIPANAVYRKYTETTGWKSFVENGKNRLASAAGEAGFCPPPADPEFIPGLNPGHYCVQLLIEDGGPNDGDGHKNGVITDPGGVVALPDVTVPVISDPDPADPVTGSVSSGGGGVSLYLMSLLWLLVLSRRKYLMAILRM